MRIPRIYDYRSGGSGKRIDIKDIPNNVLLFIVENHPTEGCEGCPTQIPDWNFLHKENLDIHGGVLVDWGDHRNTPMIFFH